MCSASGIMNGDRMRIKQQHYDIKLYEILVQNVYQIIGYCFAVVVIY